MELQIPYSVCTEISKKGVLRREATRDRRNIEDAVQLEKDKDSRSRGVPGPCAHAGGNPPESSGIKLHGISEGQEQSVNL